MLKSSGEGSGCGKAVIRMAAFLVVNLSTDPRRAKREKPVVILAVQILAPLAPAIFRQGVLISRASSAMLNQRSQLWAGTMEDLSCNGPHLLLKKFA